MRVEKEEVGGVSTWALEGDRPESLCRDCRNNQPGEPDHCPYAEELDEVVVGSRGLRVSVVSCSLYEEVRRGRHS